MNEQQLAAVKQAVEALKRADSRDGYLTYITEIEALQSIIAQHALDKKAENARELGLSYDDEPKIGCVNHDCDQCKAVQETVGDWVWSWLMDWCKRNGIAPATQDGLFAMVKDARGKFESTPPAPQPAPVQEPDGFVYGNSYWEATNPRITDDVKRFGSPRYATPPAPQPVPVKTYHDGKPWPVAPKPWVGLTDEDKEFIELTGGKSDVLLAELVEAKLREKNT
jgi:hypothetical protein